MSSPVQPSPAPAVDSSHQPSFRSGSVARMAGMPVSTLRIWEQRYQAVAPVTAASGHRLYSSADVERVVLLRQLTEQGHAIGSLAGLEMDQLRDVALAHGGDVAAPRAVGQGERRLPLRVVVVGKAMAVRLKRPTLFRQWFQRPQVVAVFDSMADAASAAPAPVDLLLWQTAGVHESAADDLHQATVTWQPRCVAVAYRFAGAAARDGLAQAGAIMAREPADDAALESWMGALHTAVDGSSGGAEGRAAGADAHGWSLAELGLPGTAGPVTPPRFDDASLTAFAGRASAMACECPGHVAELLMQITGFEAYSAGCANHNEADAELHAYLHRVAGAARVLFESALERVAVAEGLALP
ncbi:MAG: MerR family transcriptional regulator [Hydrogenophaga sp.]|nr:MerR family transcriptional regulator [Hydrogenophaga sp.]